MRRPRGLFSFVSRAGRDSLGGSDGTPTVQGTTPRSSSGVAPRGCFVFVSLLLLKRSVCAPRITVRVASGGGGFLQDSRLGRAHTRMPRTLARKPVGAFSARQNCSITPLNWVRARHHELDGCFNRHFSGLVLGPTRSAQRAAASLTFLHRQDSALICRARGTIFACLYSFGYACETSRL
jgi:hypothetical protein